MKRMTLYKMVVSHYNGDERTFLKAARELERDLNDAGEKQLSKEIGKIIRKNIKLQLSYEKTKDFIFTKELEKTLRVIERAFKENLIQKIFLHGKPGTGKTEFSEIIAKKLNVPIKKISLSKIIDSKLGESIKLLEKFFAGNERSLVFVDEVDSIASHRARGNDVFEINRILNHFLQLLDNLHPNKIVVVATNLGDHIDNAFKRRFDISINFDSYKKQDLERIFLEYQNEFRLHKFPEYSNKLNKLILSTYKFWTPAYIKRVIKISSIWLLNNELPKQQVFEILQLIKIGNTKDGIIEKLKASKTPLEVINYFLGANK